MHVNAPKGKLPTDLRAQIAERKAEILALLRRRSSSKRIVAPPITPRAPGEPAPLSFAQERLWFLEQLEPESAVYNICRASRLVGNLNTSALEASLNEIVSRHETLRTAFRLIAGRPLQVVQPTGRISIDFTDLRAVPESGRDADIQRRIKAETECPFDLTTGFLLRCKLLRVSDEEHVLILMTHHSASDAWSMGLLTRELWTLYEAFSNGKPSSLEPLPVQYSDYAVWQRNWLQGEVLDTQLAYWKKQLGDLSILNLPTDRPRTPRQSFSGARLPILLPEGLTRSVNEMSHRYAVTPFMTLLAAFQVLLYRYAGQEDVVIGSPVANRRRPEIESLIGFFVNTLVLRAKLSGKPSFSELLLRVRDICVAAHANQDLPFEKLVQELQPERDLSRNPLFQVMFVLQNATSPFTDFPGLRVEPIEIETTRSPFDLSFFLRERNGKFIGYFEYSTDLFERATIERMAGHYQTLIEGIVAAPDQPITTLPILTEAERHQIVVEWNDTAADYPKDKCIHELFEAQVERTPEAIALEFEGEEITYRELNRRANQLARYLISLGVGREKLVGICVERSIEMVVGLLGILKTSGAYLPLDPAYPNERLRFMLEDAQVAVVLTQEKLLDRAKDSALKTWPSVVCLDRDWRSIAAQSSESPEMDVDAENLAYVIYTSGSTGQPKGVLVEHNSLVNCLVSINRKTEIRETDKVLALTTITFDIAALEIFLPLIVGARIILASRGDVLDGARLKRKLISSKATVMQATPSTWKLLLGAKWKGRRNLKAICGGEALPRFVMNQLLERSYSVWNVYGPTETTIWSTAKEIESSDKTVSIGRPIANTKIFLLDSHLQLVPIGIPGELYIGGSGVARGYLNRTELTTERFVANPLSCDSNTRLYRTGDLAKYAPNGDIEWLGRVDSQVKIRGYRIELNEIEAALRHHPAVKDVVVVAPDGVAEKDLVGYVIPNYKSPLLVSELRRFLSQKLPGYMVPSMFVSLDSLPVTSNGKVDRNALPPPDGRRPEMGHDLVEPRTEVEELIADIWKKVLKIEKVGVYDDFFDLGGHSLLAAQAVARIQEVFNKDLSIREFFETPTISTMAELIANRKIDQRRANLPPIVQVPRDRAFPLSMAQKQVWALDQLFPGALFSHMPYVYRLLGPLDIEALKRSVQEIVGRHEAFRMVFRERKGRPEQYVGEIPRVEIPVVDLRHLTPGAAEKEFAELSIEDAELPFDLENGPPFRIKLIRFADDDHALLVTVHHIVCDHWSMQVFRRELIALYDAYTHGQPSHLPQVPVQLIDYVCWQKELSRRRLLKTQLAYWMKKLSVRTPTLEFRKKRKGGRRLGFGAVSETIQSDETLFAEIKAIARKENCTTFMVVVAMIGALLYAHTGRQNIRIGTTLANRGRSETEALIANCLNAVILNIKLSPEMTFKQLLEQTRDTVLGALAHRELPFGQLARALAKQKLTTNDAPLFQVLLIYQNRTFEPTKVSGLTIASWEGKYRRASQNVLLTPLDLIFDLREMSTTLTGSVTYKTTTIKAELVSQMAGWFKQTAGLLLRQPDRCLTAILSVR